MKKTVGIFFLIFGLIINISNTFAQQRGVGVRVKTADGKISDLKLYDGSYALVVGESDYTNGWDNLPGVRNDIAEVKRVLEDGGFEVQALVNLDSDTLKARINSFINDHGYEQNNRLLFYFAGHGHTQTSLDGRDLGYIVPSDTPLPDKDALGFRRKAISMDTIQGYAKQIEAKHAMFIFDSCFSGKLVSREKITIPPVILDDVAYPVRQFITAGAANQRVPDDSIFRKAFVRALEGEADRNGDKFITGTELADFLKEKVTNATDRVQTPQYGKIRDIDLDRGDFVFSISPSVSTGVSNGERARILAIQGLEEFLRGNSKQAIELANEALSLKNDLVLAVGVRGCAGSIFSTDYETARVDLEKAVRLDPMNTLFRIQLALVYGNLGEKDLMKKAANDVLQSVTAPKTALEFYIKGLSYHSLEDRDRAVSDYTKAIELNPRFVLAYVSRGTIYLNKADFNAAIRDFDKAVSLNPDTPLTYFVRGAGNLENGETDSAISDFTRAIELNPDYGRAYDLRAFARARKGDLDAAIIDLTKLIELTPKLDIGYIGRGKCYGEKKDYAAAIRDFTKAIELNPRRSTAYLSRAKAYEELGQTDLAAADRRTAESLGKK